MHKYKTEFIEFMISSGVLTFGDFVTKSGRRTPYFINTGNYRTGAQLSRLGKHYAECIMRSIGGEFDVLFGPAYKGVPIAVATAAALYSDFGLDREYCFNRKEVKDHGEKGILVGAKLRDGDRVVYVEDVITAGTSIRETLPLLKSAANVTVEHIIISVDRMERGSSGKTAAEEIRDEFGIELHSIVTVREIVEYLRSNGGDPEHIERMEAYMEQYC
ncbi:MAG: orotate phosphoribosyltransferase [Eubacteriales bacterium]|jgi:orotate phosphoribosyltransferase